jgi:hypothetical protein
MALKQIFTQQALKKLNNKKINCLILNKSNLKNRNNNLIFENL